MNNRSTPVVDLTANSASSPPLQAISSQSTSSEPTLGHRRNSSIASISAGDYRSSKRRRHDDNTFSAVPPASSSAPGSSSQQSQPPATAIESVDLTEIDETSPLSRTLAKQREDAVKAQETASSSEKKGRSILASYKCPVCMDTPTDATSTICGHLFCHKCITDTLRFGEEQRAMENDGATRARVPRGNCPVCRQALSRRDTSGPRRNLIPLQLQFMKKEAQSNPARGKQGESKA